MRLASSNSIFYYVPRIRGSQLITTFEARHRNLLTSKFGWDDSPRCHKVIVFVIILRRVIVLWPKPLRTEDDQCH